MVFSENDVKFINFHGVFIVLVTRATLFLGRFGLFNDFFRHADEATNGSLKDIHFSCQLADYINISQHLAKKRMGELSS